jgi:hypothetical protein
MGWYGDYASAREAASQARGRSQGPEVLVIDDSGEEGALWQILEVPGGKKYIAVTLLESGPRGWAYKPMDETVGPFRYDVPDGWLDMVPDPCLGYSTKWREEVAERQLAAQS